MEIEINGVKYRRRESEQKSSKTTSKMMLTALMMGAMDFGGSNYERKRPCVDIEIEYGRIQRKESKLSRNDRDWVVWRFEREFVKVD